jgi:hypothetical protein
MAANTVSIALTLPAKTSLDDVEDALYEALSIMEREADDMVASSEDPGEAKQFNRRVRLVGVLLAAVQKTPR